MADAMGYPLPPLPGLNRAKLYHYQIIGCFAVRLWHDFHWQINRPRQRTGFPSLPPTRMDNIIAAQELQIERKHFYIEFRENDRGRFLRITEEAHGRRNTIIVPSTGLDDFSATLDEVLDAVAAAPAPAATA